MVGPRGGQQNQRRITEDDLAMFVQLHGQGLGRNEIARQMDRPTGSVTLMARRVGVRFDTTNTELAVETARQQAALARTRLSLRMLNDAEALLEQMWEPATLGNFGGKDNTFRTAEVDQPPDTAKRNLAQAAALLMDRSIKLEEFDQHTGDEQVIGMLDGLELTIRRAAKELEADGASDDAPSD